MSHPSYVFRFLGIDGTTYFGTSQDSEIPSGECVGYKTIEAMDDRDGVLTTIKGILPPSNPDNHIICIGVNYRNHAEEAKLRVPSDPVMWYKPPAALSGPGELLIPAFAHTNFLDFEGELTIITSRAARDVSEADAHNYILGFTVGNDLTARTLQDPERAGGQFTRAKAWDRAAPLAPMIARLPSPYNLAHQQLTTKVNGEVFQRSPIDLIHGPAKLVSFLSQGTTLPVATAIMTGTAAGVGWFCNPKHSLKHGDEVEVEITGIGKLCNTMQFA